MALDITGEQMLLTREEAAACGLSRFYTGRLCKFGHRSERYSSNRQCVQCNAEKAKARDRLKRLTDPSYRMFRSVTNRSGQVLKGRASPTRAVGCTHSRLKDYISAQFTHGMEWANYGQWEVDHVVPLSAARGIEGIVELCHYRNLQPLWKRENQLKGGA